MRRTILVAICSLIIFAVAGNTGVDVVSARSSTHMSKRRHHKHHWKKIKKKIRRKAIKKKVWVVDQKAYDETLYRDRNMVICNGCEHEYLFYDEWVEHCSDAMDNGDFTHGSYRIEPRQIKTGTKHHAEQGHYKWIVVKPAWTERCVVGYRCPCGKRKK